MTAIVAEGNRKRLFLSPTEEHIKAVQEATPTWRPSGSLPEQARSISVQIYGFTEWHKLFTERQLTALTTFSDLLPEVRSLILEHGASAEYADAVCTYLALAVGRTARKMVASFSLDGIVPRDIVTGFSEDRELGWSGISQKS